MIFLNCVGEDVRELVPVDGMAPQEEVVFPQNEEVSDLCGDLRFKLIYMQYKDYNEWNTIHVDSFLYADDEEIDELCDKGLMSRNYCADCKSKNIKPLSMYGIECLVLIRIASLQISSLTALLWKH